MTKLVERLRWLGYPYTIEAADEIGRLTVALEIIAGRRQCLDNLMSNAEVARAALTHRPGDDGTHVHRLDEREGDQ
jgi:hypothetical protein